MKYFASQPVLILAAVWLLGGLNIASGGFQLSLLAQGPTLENLSGQFASPHYYQAPIPIVIHLLGGVLFNLLAPLQLIAPLRQRHPRFHRMLGWILVLSALAASLSALWMNQFFPAFGTGLKYLAILLFGLGMMLSIFYGVKAIKNHDVRRHRLWMSRAIAIGLAPAVARLILLPLFILFGELNVLFIEAVVWFSNLFNLLVVEGYFRYAKPSVAALAPGEIPQSDRSNPDHSNPSTHLPNPG